MSGRNIVRALLSSSTVKSLAILFAGALASVVGTYLFSDFSPTTLFVVSGVIVGLLVYGSGAGEGLLKAWRHWQRGRGTLEVGILSDMGGEPRAVSKWAKWPIDDWEKALTSAATAHNVKIKVRRITTAVSFDGYAAVFNPYGGAYPESGFSTLANLKAITAYVAEGGLFINVADIPTYWAYVPQVRKRMHTAPKVYYSPSRIENPFEGTPLMSQLGVRIFAPVQVDGWELGLTGAFAGAINPSTLEALSLDRFAELTFDYEQDQLIDSIESVVEILDVERSDGKRAWTVKATPFFAAPYGAGRFLFSLTGFHRGSTNDNLKEWIAGVVILSLQKARRQSVT